MYTTQPISILTYHIYSINYIRIPNVDTYNEFSPIHIESCIHTPYNITLRQRKLLRIKESPQKLRLLHLQITTLHQNLLLSLLIKLRPTHYSSTRIPTESRRGNRRSLLSIGGAKFQRPSCWREMCHLPKNFMTTVLSVLTIVSTLLTMKLFIKAPRPSTIIDSV